MGFAIERNRPPPRLRVFPWLPAWAFEEGGSGASADQGEPPYVLFVCQNQAQRDDFLTRADQELTGHRWHPSHPTEEHQYVGRRRILFCDERDIHHRQLEARRLPPYPPGHPARHGRDVGVRGVRLPGGADGSNASSARAEAPAAGSPRGPRLRAVDAA
jgi:hypothetical protein